MLKEHNALSVVRGDLDAAMAKYVASKKKLQGISKECNAALQRKRVIVGKLHSMKKKNKVKATHGAKLERADEVPLSLASAPHKGAASGDLDLINAEHINVMRTLFGVALVREVQTLFQVLTP